MSAASKNRDKVPDWLRWRSTVSPGSLAVKVGSAEWTYRELQQITSDLAAALHKLGLSRGDRIALLMSPSENYIGLVHAAARLGAVVVPLNHRQSIPELASQLGDSRPSLVVADDSGGDKARELEKTGWVGRWERVSRIASAAGRARPIVGVELDISAPHAIIYTSGSSGTPQGVELTLSNLLWNAVSVGLRVGASPDDRWLLCMPLFHVGGYAILFRSLLQGSGIVLHPRFDPKRVSLSLDNDEITLVSFVPTMLTELLEARGRKPLRPRVRTIFLGGDQAPPTLVTAIRERRLPVLLTYGMTETCSHVAVSNAWSSSDGPAYLPILPTEVSVTRRGRKGKVEFAKEGEVGEVAVRGPTVFTGYWRRPTLTRSKFKGGWFLTGDLGVAAEAVGRRASAGVVILGRKEETIITGGEKVFPAEVEAALKEHSAVKDAVVVGVDDEKWGQKVVAVVEAKGGFAGRPPTSAELSAFLRSRVGRYKVPKQYHIWETLPRTPTGKVRRAEVRLMLARGGS